MMKILADKYLYKLDKLVPAWAKLDLYDPDDGLPEGVSHYDALLIRTVTKINAKTLSSPGKLSFIGSATAGFDHVDLDYLNDIGIAFARSEGCNANAVAEYVITALYKWADERDVDLPSRQVGIVGCGNTGSRVAGYLKELGVQTVLYDPPKALREKSFTSSAESDLLECDILTFHTPLRNTGSHPTVHICSEEWLKQGFSLVVNTSRGGVVDEEALFKSHQEGKTKDYILDVWENEPLFDDDVAQHAFLTTPHIAGYSKEAKWKASEMVVHKMCEHFALKKPGSSFNLHPSLSEKPAGQNSFAGFLWKYSNLKKYDRLFKPLIGLTDDEKSHRFAKLRSETDTRFEFSAIMKSYGSRSNLPDEATIFLNST
ncbi:MAG TPA: 4-phosphoerythronate dehydrogenase [Balneolaceae bacterium]|nr:4-phosphoerythronate dehydrogenase [Balneolaceae bacterium]